MAPKTSDEDFKFIMTCIKHSPPTSKPDFDKVAKELGAKSANACYHRHWGIMKKWGMAGGGVGRARRAGDTGIGAGAAAGAGTTKKPRGGGTKRKASEMADATASENGLGSASDDVEEKSVITKARPSKKAAPKGIKTEPNDDEVDSGQVVIKNEHVDDEQSVAEDGVVEPGT
ncbi:hypothetical protein LTR84_000510 [Exophiala bonariae]|uniref:Myb-like DNA-binding domain-containing protein n=1 Tax=Exophiala bonariae TaxID=1690606 RepID=A0AAV9NRE1_9EURO|nr:hypothetical protein LTR84_000510 [Exophiala bonariae]